MENVAVVRRSYKLKLYPNKTKFDTARYTNMRFNQYMNMFLGRCFFGEKHISTIGMGLMANQALYKSYKIIKGLRRLHKKTGIKINVPYVTKQANFASIRRSKKSSFDYWISISNLWTKYNIVKLPAKSHRALNRALRNGWRLSNLCEFKLINSNPYAIVFVSKEAPQLRNPNKIIGCDVGIIHSVTTSEGYKGYGLSRIIRIQKRRYAERMRQGHRISSKVKSCIKQILDREAKRIIRRSVNFSAGIAIENPKRLVNLRSSKLQGWARNYFANRLGILGKENGIKIVGVNPYQTSVTCSKCGVADKRSRMGRIFHCISCGHIDHADRNAAENIATIGRVSLLSDGKKSGQPGRWGSDRPNS